MREKEVIFQVLQKCGKWLQTRGMENHHVQGGGITKRKELVLTK